MLYNVQNGVAGIELNRPEVSNALDLSMSTELLAALEAASLDDSVKVVLLLGRGRLFCGGGDVALMAAADDRREILFQLASEAHRVIRTLDRLEKPVVAGVQGAAAGAGLALTLLADLVIAGESAKFLTAYTAIGLTPDCGTSWLLPRVVGLKRALELTLTNRRLTATEAVEWGIVTSTCPDEDVATTAQALARQLATGPAGAYGLSRALLRSADLRPLDEHLELEARTISSAGTTPEATALIDAFVGNR